MDNKPNPSTNSTPNRVEDQQVLNLVDEAQRQRWMGFYAAVATGSSLLGLLAAGLLGDIGWRWAFLIYLTGGPFAALAWFGMRRTSAATKRTPTIKVRGPEPRGPFRDY